MKPETTDDHGTQVEGADEDEDNDDSDNLEPKDEINGKFLENSIIIIFSRLLLEPCWPIGSFEPVTKNGKGESVKS